jgi:hypothetical protein
MPAKRGDGSPASCRAPERRAAPCHNARGLCNPDLAARCEGGTDRLIPAAPPKLAGRIAAPFHLRYGRIVVGLYGRPATQSSPEVAAPSALLDRQHSPQRGPFASRNSCGPVSPALWPDRPEALESALQPGSSVAAPSALHAQPLCARRGGLFVRPRLGLAARCEGGRAGSFRPPLASD